MTYLTFTVMDASKEKAVSSIKVVDIAIDGSNYAGILSAQTTLAAAISAVTNGNAHQERIVAEDTRLTNVVPTDDSRREMKWLVSVEDDVTFAISWFTLGCADWLNCVRAGVTDFWDLENKSAEMTALVSAVETHMKSALGNAVTVLSVEDVGRNN